jgi:hypothetical protein
VGSSLNSMTTASFHGLRLALCAQRLVRDGCRHVGGEAHVEVRRAVTALENVDESLGAGHEGLMATWIPTHNRKNAGEYSRMTRRVAVSATTAGGQATRIRYSAGFGSEWCSRARLRMGF